MSFFSYKMTRDYGFAPNPFGGFLTLANCKPHVRRAAVEGDWVLGTGSQKLISANRVFHLMQVTEKITFDEYWNDIRFQGKRPILNGSIVQMHGDNIYFRNAQEEWCQVNSHHSYSDGSTNHLNLENDLSGDFVLISNRFFYFGENNFRLPKEFLKLSCHARDFCKPDENLGLEFVKWLSANYSLGIHGDPYHWKIYNQLSI